MPSARERVLKHCPSLFSLANLSTGEWDKIERRFVARTNHIDSTIKTASSITVGTTIYDVIKCAESGNKSHIAFLRFIEYLCEQILLTIPKVHHSRLRMSAINILSNFDRKRSFYLDPVGEFVALLNILKGSAFRLTEVETALPSGKKADFAILRASSQTILQIEVLNIHFGDGKIHNEDDLYIFLSKRIEDKLMSKIGKLHLEKGDSNFALLPVAWCDLDEVQHFPATFIRVEKQYPSLPICILAQQHSLEEDNYNYLFATVPEVLRRLAK